LSRHIAKEVRHIAAILVGFLAVGGFTFVLSQTQTPASDPVAKLAARLESGEATLEYSGRWGYLESLLKQLDIHTDSQVLVFSKTSLQQERIGPRTPRAIFFNDTIAVGSVQNGELFEITVDDADAGVQFYALPVRKVDSARIEKERYLCLQCHNYRLAPQTFVATVYPSVDGTPAYLGGNDLFNVTDSRTPFEDRWGGWYVSGTHGSMQHLGNAVAHNPYRPVELETKGTQNLTSLTSKFDVTPYLEPTSDLIALMTLEHQTRAHYYMAALNAQFRSKAKPEDINAAIENLVSYLTFSDEAKLTDPIKGVSTFTETFPMRGPRDSKGRSLRDFDLKTRLFRYPLSYTLYSSVFDQMIPEARERIYRGLWDALNTSDPKKKAALEIFRETKPNLPDYWR
jgi:hypothetical protein